MAWDMLPLGLTFSLIMDRPTLTEWSRSVQAAHSIRRSRSILSVPAGIPLAMNRTLRMGRLAVPLSDPSLLGCPGEHGTEISTGRVRSRGGVQAVIGSGHDYEGHVLIS